MIAAGTAGGFSALFFRSYWWRTLLVGGAWC
jgi:hypothetical protein